MKKKTIIGLIILILFIATVSFAVIKETTLNKIQHVEIDKSNENLGIKNDNKEAKKAIDHKDEEKEEVFNILLLGTDSRGKRKGRADAIMLLTINLDKKTINLSSLMRDTQVIIRGQKDKLGHACAYGGGEEMLRVINDNFNLEVKDFAEISMLELGEIIDNIGKIEVNITETERREINYRVKELARINKKKNAPKIYNKGLQELTGDQIVAYMRIRKTAGGDFKRTERQREIVKKLIKEILRKDIGDIYNISKETFPRITTTMTPNEIETLITKMITKGTDYTISQVRYPRDNECEGIIENGIYYLKITDINSLIRSLNNKETEVKETKVFL